MARMLHELFNTALPLSHEDQQALYLAAWQTWEAVADDILEANDGADIPRADVIEIVLDANYLTTYNPKLPETVKAWLKTSTYEAKIAALQPVFPHLMYGY